jgi:predicted RNA methylase
MKAYALFPRTPGLFSSLNVQKNMLQDRLRIEKFKEAVFKNVKPGDVVVDLGTGTGILAIYAAQAGARQVYAIEETDVADVAESVIERNGFGSVVTVLRANSSEVVLPELADVIIAEVVGHFLFEEGIIESIAAARASLLKPGGTIIPTDASVFLAPVEMGADFTEVSYWSTWKDPDLSVIGKLAANSAYVETIEPKKLLAEPEEFFHVRFREAQPGTLSHSTEFRCYRRGRFDAVAGWFRLRLDQDVCLSTSPFDAPTHWQQCIFPLETPVMVESGETIRTSISVEAFAPGCRWRWEVMTGTGSSEQHEVNITYGQDARLLKERF